MAATHWRQASRMRWPLGADDVPAGHAPFALWNRSGNRAVALLLRSPFHRLVSRQLTLITVTGRRSGRQHTLPVAYSESEQRLAIPVMWPERKLWWRNLRDGAPVRLRLRGVERTGQAHARVDEDGGVRVEVLLDPAA
jgi:F420H(2)-dependent quinone reductase